MNSKIKRYKAQATIHIVIININPITPTPGINNHNSAIKNINMKLSTSMMAPMEILDSLFEKRIGAIIKKENNGSMNNKEGKDQISPLTQANSKISITKISIMNKSSTSNLVFPKRNSNNSEGLEYPSKIHNSHLIGNP